MSQETPKTDLVPILVKALRQLGDAGKPEDANRLAAQAWWMLKDQDARAAEHVNGVMHYLARLEASAQTDTPSEESAPQ